ncbi:hypothetical protein GCM10009069_26780 [Algimonas arctica]|uniref:Uncharacterized protein n=1 Tax=Algimonas arctica TaxID=1479486 RepID=A0A8J3G3A3_9PROT|nr:hypothetical protein GCM10009069_26780 [Algimonas arctica]
MAQAEICAVLYDDGQATVARDLTSVLEKNDKKLETIVCELYGLTIAELEEAEQKIG